MRGLITFPDVIQNAGTVIEGFGWACFFRCVRAAVVSTVTGKPSTFLSCI